MSDTIAGLAEEAKMEHDAASQRSGGADGDLDATPADRRRRKVRDAIVAAAEQVFAREGVEGLSIRRLAEAVDYSPAAIYKYFTSKAELLGALKEAFFERLVARMHAASLDSMEPTPTLLRKAFIDYVEIGLERPHHYAAAFGGVVTLDECETDWAMMEGGQSAAMEAYDVLLKLIARGVDLGELRGGDPRLMAYSLWASMHGLVLLCLRFPGFPNGGPAGELGVTQNAFVATHADLAVRGLEACRHP